MTASRDFEDRYFTASATRSVASSFTACDPYTRICEISEDATRSPASFTGLVASEPHSVDGATWASIARRNDIIRRWHRTCLRILAASLDGSISPAIAAALLDHLPSHIGWDHHRRFPLERLGVPCFFRTDQAADGTVLEVQCPGSLWGVHEILREYYAEAGVREARRSPPLSARFLSALAEKLGGRPVIHHLLDNSSHPAGERFFIQRARAGASYFGFDAVRPQECNFVRSHDFPSLLVENFAAERLERLASGALHYDLPPVALFDQKVLLAFPFWDETRDHFDDDIRGLFPYTNVLSGDGVRLDDGEWVSIEQFSALPRKARRYFLKYAGCDVSKNWGSRAVYHLGKLSTDACRKRLEAAAAAYVRGERWIVQQECPSRESVSFVTRSGELSSVTAHSKHSVFYGPSGPLGVLSMYEDFYKVHGSTETVTTVGFPSPRDVPDDHMVST